MPPIHRSHTFSAVGTDAGRRPTATIFAPPLPLPNLPPSVRAIAALGRPRLSRLLPPFLCDTSLVRATRAANSLRKEASLRSGGRASRLFGPSERFPRSLPAV